MVTTSIRTNNISGLTNQPGTSITISNPLDGNGVPGANPNDVSFTISANSPLAPGNHMTVNTASAGYLTIDLNNGNNFISIDNMPWANDADGAPNIVTQNQSRVAVRSISTGSGDDTIYLNRTGVHQTIDTRGGDDFVQLYNGYARDVKLGDGDDTLVLMADSVAVSEEEIQTKAIALGHNHGPTLEGGAGYDELRLQGEWTLVNNPNYKFTLLNGAETSTLHYDRISLVKFFPDVIDGTVFYPPFIIGTLTQNLSMVVKGFESIRLICFTSGMMLDTPKGKVAIDDLFVGDVIETKSGPRAIRWIGRRHMDRHDLTMHPKMAPIVIPAHAFGENCPSEPLMFSPQHRIVARSNIVKSMFGYPKSFVTAKQLIGFNGIDVDYSVKEVTYFHIMLDEHEIVNVSGLDVETLYPGPQALDMMDPDARSEILTLFPCLAENNMSALPFETYAPTLKGREARALFARHLKAGDCNIQAVC